MYDLPQLARDARGRAVVNLLNLGEGEQITDCRAVRDFDQPDHFLVMATARGLVKKTPLEAYSRPLKSGIIAIKLREGDALVDVVVAKPGDELLLATAHGMAIRFKQSDARADGPQHQRREGHPAGGRRFGGRHGRGRSRGHAVDRLRERLRQAHAVRAELGGRPDEELPERRRTTRTKSKSTDIAATVGRAGETQASRSVTKRTKKAKTASQRRYRTQGRGGKGLRDIKTTERNGPVVGIVAVSDADELLMMTAHGKIQRIAASDMSIIGRNTQGVKIMSLDDDDTLVAVKRVPKEEEKEEEEGRRRRGREPFSRRVQRALCGILVTWRFVLRCVVTFPRLLAISPFVPIAQEASDDYSALR